jgi:A/G-specific adenine glycosylase
MPRKQQKPVPPDPSKLLAWYDRHHRILPWRALPGQMAVPYRVWLSEVMLQQTTVPVVGAYYEKFLQRWPTIEKLARAKIDDVMAAWAGLGYYRRARMLHACAQKIVSDHGGKFPSDQKLLRAMPGIGDYTAAAIVAIAFDQSANVVDGNVERVMTRLYAVSKPLAESKKLLRAYAEKLLPAVRHGDYAQALMDLGATVCTVRQPRCTLCPWQNSCMAKTQGIAADLPVPAVKKAKPLRLATAYWLQNQRGEVLLRRRPPQGLLGGMVEIPTSPWQVTNRKKPVFPKLLADYAPQNADWQLLDGDVRHSFTHFDLYIKVAVGKISRSKADGFWVRPKAVEQQGLPSVMRKIARHVLAVMKG